VEDKFRLADLTWKTVWGNTVLKTLVLGGTYAASLAIIGVYWGRVGQYGWHIVLGVLGGILLLSISAILARQKTNAVKKVLKL
jgi:hypothetical protein